MNFFVRYFKHLLTLFLLSELVKGRLIILLKNLKFFLYFHMHSPNILLYKFFKLN